MSEMLTFEVPIVSFDLETTDSDKHRAGIVQYGIAAQLAPDGPIKRTSSLVNCQERIKPGAERIHGISEKEKRTGVPIEQALDVIKKSIAWAHTKGGIVVAMNMQFDWTILTMTGLREGHQPHAHAYVQKVPLYDPLVVDRHLDKYRKGPKNLETLLDLYGLRDELVSADHSHEAARDAEAALLVAREQLGSFEQFSEIPMDKLTATMRAWHVAWADDYEQYLDRSGQEHKHIDREWPFVHYQPDKHPPEDDSPPFDPDSEDDEDDDFPTDL